MLPTIEYNRSKRCYEIDGFEETFPAGKDGKREAFQTAVYLASPELFRMAKDVSEKYPSLASRAWKATEIIITGAILQPSDCPNIVALVDGNDEYGDYTISAVGEDLACSCLDWTGGTAPYTGDDLQPRCSHILAFEFSLKMGE